MNYHKTIDTLPYWNFLQIRKSNDLRYLFEIDSYLDLSKAKPNAQHLKIFESILHEYNDIILQREKAATLFDFEKQIGEIESERFICQVCLSQLKILPNTEEFKEQRQKFIDELDNLGYLFNGNIEALEGKIDALLNELDDLVIARNRLNAGGDNSTPERIINEIEKYRKVSIDITKISVKQYLVYETDYIEYVAMLNKKQK